MNRYGAGRRKEWQARDDLYRRGASLVVRSAGSKSCADLVAFFGAVTWIVQVKFCKPHARWQDKNWQKLCALRVGRDVRKLVYVYRRGQKGPAILEA